MSYRYRSRRQMKKLARQSRRNLIVTILLIAILFYLTINWVLPFLINGLGFVKSIVNPPRKTISSFSENASLAPPILNIPYEATNSAQIDIRGYGSPNSKINLYLDDEVKKNIEVASDGTFTAEKISLSIGTNTIFAKTLDEENRESLPSKAIKIIFDNEKPLLNISEPEDGKKIQGGDKKIKVSGKTEPGVKIFVNENQVIVDKEGLFSSDQLLNDGENIISIKAMDLASNITEIERAVAYNP